MEQTKLESLLEKVVDTLSGMFLSTLVWIFVITPVWGLEMPISSSIQIVITFTIVSMLRGYFWRRFFNAGVHKTIHKFITHKHLIHKR